MKILYYVLFFCFFYISSTAQLRVHFMSGMANYKGDLQQKELTLQHAKHVYTIGATYSITGHLSIRADLSATKLEADDKDNQSAALRARNLNFKTNLSEVSIMGEYDLFDLENYKMTPYFFAGVGRFRFNSYTSDTAGNKLYLQPLNTEGKSYHRSQFNIPFGAGIKYALSDYIHIGAEFGTRKLFTDYLDDVSNNYMDKNTLLAAKGSTAVTYAFRGDELKNNASAYPAAGTKRGNPLLMDNYYFGEVRLSIRLPWFEASNNENQQNRKRYNCPRF